MSSDRAIDLQCLRTRLEKTRRHTCIGAAVSLSTDSTIKRVKLHTRFAPRRRQSCCRHSAVCTHVRSVHSASIEHLHKPDCRFMRVAAVSSWSERPQPQCAFNAKQIVNCLGRQRPSAMHGRLQSDNRQYTKSAAHTRLAPAGARAVADLAVQAAHPVRSAFAVDRAPAQTRSRVVADSHRASFPAGVRIISAHAGGKTDCRLLGTPEIKRHACIGYRSDTRQYTARKAYQACNGARAVADLSVRGRTSCGGVGAFAVD
jgi:hypothetical protein